MGQNSPTPTAETLFPPISFCFLFRPQLFFHPGRLPGLFRLVRGRAETKQSHFPTPKQRDGTKLAQSFFSPSQFSFSCGSLVCGVPHLISNPLWLQSMPENIIIRVNISPKCFERNRLTLFPLELKGSGCTRLASEMTLWLMVKGALLDHAVKAAAKSPVMQSTAQKIVKMQKEAGSRIATIASVAVDEVKKDVLAAAEAVSSSSSNQPARSSQKRSKTISKGGDQP